MSTLTPDRARALLGGGLNGHDVVAGHANRNGLTVLTTPRRAWSWPRRPKEPRDPKAPAKRDGSRLIAFSAALLTLLAVGLLSVSIAAQYRYFLSERHQITASMIESGALDVGMLVFSLLALGLARKGLSARPERALIVACATTSAVMNYAPAQAGDWRSVLAWTMPPVFLAVVADRVIAVTRRHFLGMSGGRSAWRDGLGWAAMAAKVTGLGMLYVLRVPLAPVSTSKGLRQAVLNATPLPQAAPAAPLVDVVTSYPRSVSVVQAALRERALRNPPGTRRSGATKTARFLDLVKERHGELAGIPLDQASQIATAIAPEAELHPASARTALLKAVRAALPAGEGDGK
jgi:hypothetical protein